MDNVAKKTLLCLPALITLALTGCGGSSSSSSPVDTSVSLSATVVDPYIEGAVFCVDTDRSKTCDAGEPRSTASAADGSITFDLDAPLPAGSLIIADPASLGTHNGVAFTLAMGALVGEGADGFVISPMTTLQSSSASLTQAGDVSASLTHENIAELLRTAGLTDITAADISADPMQGIGDLSGVVTDAQLARIQATLSMYGFMKLFNESDALNGKSVADILASGLDTSGSGDVYNLLSAMVGAIQDVVSPALIAQAQGPVTAANGLLPPGAPALPTVTAEVIVKAGVAILDRVVGDAAAACNAASGDYTAGLAAATTHLGDGAFPLLVEELGLAYYAAHNQAALEALLTFASAPNMTALMMGAPQATPLDAGLACASGHFTVDNILNASCIPS